MKQTWQTILDGVVCNGYEVHKAKADVQEFTRRCFQCSIRWD